MNSSEDDTIATAGRPPQAQHAVLLIGYGNLLRCDDGVGPAIVSRLAASFLDNPRCVCLTPHQLTPELAEDMAQAQRVLFIDASLELPAGKIGIRRLRAPAGESGDEQALGGGGTGGGGVLGHQVSPDMIIALAKSLFGSAPEAWAVGVGVENLSVGDRLSPPVSHAARRLSRHLAHRVRQWSTFASRSDARKEGCK